MSDSTTYTYTADGVEIVNGEAPEATATDPPEATITDPPVVDPESTDPDPDESTNHDESDPAPSGPVTVIPSPLNPFMKNQDPA